jgi:GNAT superfamily N-acetyltransferase
MLRPAVVADLPALLAIRDRAEGDALSDPELAGEADLRRLIATGAVTVSAQADEIAGFAAVDGDCIHLLVDTTQRSRGIGRDLLAAACAAVAASGHGAATIALPAGAAAERHYRAAGWQATGQTPAGGMVLKKPF